MTQIKELIGSLEKAIIDHVWERCAEICFSVLFQMPSDIQIRLASTMIRRYLPIFKARWPAITWPEQILNETARWVEQFGRALPEEPDAINPADAAFKFSFDALLLAQTYRLELAILTPSCAAVINSAINTHATNVWIADDPEAVKMWEAHDYLHLRGRSVIENPAAIAVTEREWRVAANLLSDEAGKTTPDEVNLDKAKQMLTRWKENEMLLIVPAKAGDL